MTYTDPQGIKYEEIDTEQLPQWVLNKFNALFVLFDREDLENREFHFDREPPGFMLKTEGISEPLEFKSYKKK